MRERLALQIDRGEQLPLDGVCNAVRVAFVGQAGIAGGAERTLATLLDYLPNDICSIAILFEDGTFADELRSHDVPVVIVNAPGSVVNSSRERPQVRALIDSFVHAVRLARQLRRLDVAIVYTNTMKAHVVGGIAARLAGIACIMHFHDIVDGMLMQALRLVARATSVERIACSQVVADAFSLDRTTVSYGPIVLEAYRHLPRRDDARTRLGLPLDVPIVALVGRINRWKGHDRFIRIAAEVNRVMPVHFLIVGAPLFRDADFVPELEKNIDELAVRNVVSFIPWVDDVRLVYAAIDVNANCSTREPLGRAVAEAAAAGVPSVCFDDSGAAETVTDRRLGRAVPAGDEHAFAAALVDILTDLRLEESSAFVRRSAARFEATGIAAEVAAIIRRVAGPSAALVVAGDNAA